MSSFAKFYFRPGENERVETEVMLTPDSRAAIHGVVISPDRKPIADALVMLYLSGKLSDDISLLCQTFTDDTGHFVLGPLTPGQLYLVKIYKNSVRLRELEILAQEE